MRGPNRPYKPYGAARTLLYCKDPEILIEGPAGTGKSRAVLEKIFIVANKYDGCRIAIARETRKSLTSTILVTWEELVVPQGHPVLKGARREQRSIYRFPNGSEIVCCGLDDPDKIMSGEFDLIYVAEATDTQEDTVEKLTTRLRWNRLPYQQLILDCNPAHPLHWLNLRFHRPGKTRLLSRHEDNPTVTEQYLNVLRDLTGHRRARLFEGLWVAAEGARWPTLEKRTHGFRMRERFPQGLPSGAYIVMGIDAGQRAPYAAHWIACVDNEYYVFRTDYKAEVPATEQGRRMVRMTAGNERIARAFADPASWSDTQRDPNLRKTSEKSIADYWEDEFKKDPRFPKSIERGNNKSRVHMWATFDALIERGNGWPDLWIEEDACEPLWREFAGAVYAADPLNAKEDIDKSCDDHALTALGYALHTLVHGPRKEAPIRTSDDLMAAIRAEKTRRDAELDEESKWQ